MLLKVLGCNHLPIGIKEFTKNYKSHALSIGTEHYHTDPVLVSRGVLQGDCLSPLLFNLVVKTLIKTIDQKKLDILDIISVLVCYQVIGFNLLTTLLC